MTCCAFGPCSKSKTNNGSGCYLCDVIAALPQQRPRDATPKRPRATELRAAEKAQKQIEKQKGGLF